MAHSNGWSVVQEYLKRRGLRQKDLAALLHVSAPAISQFKSGRIRLNRTQIAAIAAYLQMDDEALRRWFAEIIDARFFPAGLFQPAAPPDALPDPPSEAPPSAKS